MGVVAEQKLLEREVELGVARELIAGAKAGGGALALVEGAPGVGKTRLLREVSVLAREAGLEIAGARASELERDFAFGVVRQLFEPRVSGMLTERRQRLLAGAAGLTTPSFDALEPDGMGPRGEDLHSVLHGLYWLTANLAAEAPLAIIVDDAQWGDAPSLRFLTYLSNRLDGLPLFLAVGMRTSELASELDVLDELATNPMTRLIRPRPLSAAAVDELIRDALGADPDPSFSAACFEVTKGNPLLVREVLAVLSAEKTVPGAAQATTVRQVAPRSVARSVARRFRRLGPEAGELARAVSVLGDGAPLHAAARLARLDAAAAAEAADALAQVDILRSDALEFTHPLIRAVVYSELSPLQRGVQHRAAADILAKQGSRDDEVALHLLVCRPDGDPWVVSVLRRAARRALTQRARDVAATYLERALAEPPPAEERGQVLVELASVELISFRLTGLDHLREALELADDPRSRGIVALQLGRYLFAWGMFAEADKVFEDALEGLGGKDPKLGEQLEAQRLCLGLMDPSVGTLVTDARAASLIEHSDRVSDPVMLAGLGTTAAFRTPPARTGADLAERALTSGRLPVEDPPIIYGAAVIALVFADRLEQAKTIVDQTLAEAFRRGSFFGQGLAFTVRALVEVRLGSIVAAEADARSAFRGMNEAPVQDLGQDLRLLAPWVLVALTDCLIERGELQEASRLLEQYPLAGSCPILLRIVLPAGEHGPLRLARTARRKGSRDLRECGRRLETRVGSQPGLIPWRAALAPALAAAGEREEARALAHQEIGLARAFDVPRELGIALRAAGLVEHDAEGIELLREAVNVLEAGPAELEHARALTDLGAALRREGHRSEAREPLRAGLGLAQQCGATALAERAHGELLATGARPRRFVRSGVDALTVSERRVADMASERLTNRDIAQALFVTEKTVEAHLHNTYQKLDINSRSELSETLARPEAVAIH